jgi:hypothetical protein
VEGTEFTESILPAEARSYLYGAVHGETRWTRRPAKETLDHSMFIDRLLTKTNGIQAPPF